MTEQSTQQAGRERAWRCFHCDEVFDNYGAAAAHFGADPTKEPGCLLDQVAVEEGGKPERGRGLLMALRNTEAERDEWMQRAIRAEAIEEVYDGQCANLTRYFGTTCAWSIHDQLDNERFRADHAMKLLDAAAIPFDQPTPERAPSAVSPDPAGEA